MIITKNIYEVILNIAGFKEAEISVHYSHSAENQIHMLLYNRMNKDQKVKAYAIFENTDINTSVLIDNFEVAAGKGIEKIYILDKGYALLLVEDTEGMDYVLDVDYFIDSRGCFHSHLNIPEAVAAVVYPVPSLDF